jgi:ParB family transcriptional regulator, chromosome partitioning protein
MAAPKITMKNLISTAPQAQEIYQLKSRIEELELALEQTPVFDQSPGANQINIIWVAHGSIHRDTEQSRRYFDPDELSRMAASMQEVGIIDPLTVRPHPGSDDEYDLLGGEKRHRAAALAGIESIPVRVFEVSDRTAEDIKTVSNLQRSDLNKWEETNAIMGMLCRHLNKSQAEVISLLNQAANQKRGLTDNVVRKEEWEVVEAVFTLVGRLTPESFRKHRVPLLRLSEPIQTVLQQGKLDYTKVNEILKVKEPVQQEALLADAIAQNLPLSQVRERIDTLKKTILISQDDSVQDGSPSIYQRITRALQHIKKSKNLRDPRKQKRLEKLLAELEALIGD